MTEDAQPNELCGNSVSTARAPFIRSTHVNTQSRGVARLAIKRPNDRSHLGSSAKRRLDKVSRKEVVRELPPDCRKGVAGCHKNRKRFIAHELEGLQKSELGLKVLGYSISDDAVHFLCTQADLINRSLAPSSSHSVQQKESNQLEVELAPLPSRYSPAPESIIPTIIGPRRFFKSGSLSFKGEPLVTVDPLAERVINDTSGASTSTGAGHSVSVADLMFGKQGPLRPMQPPLSAPGTSRSVSVGSVNGTSVSTPGSRRASSVSPAPTLLNQIVAEAPASEYSPPFSGISPLPSTSLDLPAMEYSFEPDGDEFRLPTRQQHDKLRRLLWDPSSSSHFIISKHGALEGVDIASRKHWHIGQDPSPTRAAVDDACLVTDGHRSVAVIGHGRDNQQLSLINTEHIKNGVASVVDLQRPWNSSKKGGVSAVASMKQPFLFASGGYDHCVHLWRLKDDLSTPSPEPLSIKHNSQVQSILGIYDTSSKLISAGADCCVHVWDLSSERNVNTLRTSNSVYHVHPTSSPFCTLLELAHREFQFEIRDHRLVPTTAAQRFGYPNLQFHGRFMKGSSLSNYFASGDRDGHVRLWDLRNTEKSCAKIECLNGQKIAHAVFQASRLFVCSEGYQIRILKHDLPL